MVSKKSTSANVVSEKKTKTTKSKKSEPEVKVEVDVDVEVEKSEKTKKKREQPTKESILAAFDELILSLENDILLVRQNSKQKGAAKGGVGIKKLRTYKKEVNLLKNSVSRVVKQKNSKRKPTNVTSGFSKKVKISDDMAKFIGVSSKEPISRVDVTKALCKYVKDNNLQNPADRRKILADVKLTKLLKYDASKDELSYARLQVYMKPHFLK